MLRAVNGQHQIISKLSRRIIARTGNPFVIRQSCLRAGGRVQPPIVLNLDFNSCGKQWLVLIWRKLVEMTIYYKWVASSVGLPKKTVKGKVISKSGKLVINNNHTVFRVYYIIDY